MPIIIYCIRLLVLIFRFTSDLRAIPFHLVGASLGVKVNTHAAVFLIDKDSNVAFRIGRIVCKVKANLLRSFTIDFESFFVVAIRCCFRRSGRVLCAEAAGARIVIDQARPHDILSILLGYREGMG